MPGPSWPTTNIFHFFGSCCLASPRCSRTCPYSKRVSCAYCIKYDLLSNHKSCALLQTKWHRLQVSVCRLDWIATHREVLCRLRCLDWSDCCRLRMPHKNEATLHLVAAVCYPCLANMDGQHVYRIPDPLQMAWKGLPRSDDIEHSRWSP